MHAFIKQLKFHPYEKNHPDQHPYATGILCTGISRYIDMIYRNYNVAENYTHQAAPRGLMSNKDFNKK